MRLVPSRCHLGEVGEVEGCEVEGVRTWPLGLLAKSKGVIQSRSRMAILASGFAGEVKGYEVEQRSGFVARSLWVAGKVEARGSPTMGSLFFLSLSLFARQRDLTCTLSLSLSLFSGKWYLKVK